MRVAVFVLCVVAAALAGCGGGGSSSSMMPASGGSKNERIAQATLRIVIPQKTGPNGKRRPAYISPSTTQLVWRLDGVLQSTVALSTSNPECSGSPVTCTVPFYVSPGYHTFSFTLEDSLGNALSAASVVATTLTAGQANTLSVTLGGIAASFSVTSSEGSTFTPQSSTVYGKIPITLVIDPLDADGNYIVGTGAVAVTATLSPNPSASPPLASATLTSSGSNTYTLTSTYSATNPAAAGGGLALYVVATPYPNSGASTLTATYTLSFVDPWLYVAQSGAGKVTTYDEAGTAQSQTISGLSTPSAVVFGQNSTTPSPLPSSYVYVAQVIPANPTPTPTAAPQGAIGAYNGDGSAATLTGSFSGLGVPAGLAYDTNLNDLYVLNSIGTVLQAYDAQGNATSVITSAPSIGNPTGIAFDDTNDELYVTTTSGIACYAENGSLVSSVVSANTPAGVAYDPYLDEIFVANQGNSTVSVYTPALVLASSFSVIASPAAIAFDPYARVVYVANSTSIQGYTESGTSLSLSFPALSSPSSIAVVP